MLSKHFQRFLPVMGFQYGIFFNKLMLKKFEYFFIIINQQKICFHV